MPSEQERLRILEMIEQGLISTEDGLSLLNALNGDASDEDMPDASIPSLIDPGEGEVWEESTGDPLSEAEQPEPESEPERVKVTSDQVQDPSGTMGGGFRKFRSWWWIPMWIGVAITVIAGGFMFLAYQSGGFSFWFACTWFPFLLGVAVMAGDRHAIAIVAAAGAH